MISYQICPVLYPIIISTVRENLQLMTYKPFKAVTTKTVPCQAFGNIATS